MTANRSSSVFRSLRALSCRRANHRRGSRCSGAGYPVEGREVAEPAGEIEVESAAGLILAEEGHLDLVAFLGSESVWSLEGLHGFHPARSDRGTRGPGLEGGEGGAERLLVDGSPVRLGEQVVGRLAADEGGHGLLGQPLEQDDELEDALAQLRPDRHAVGSPGSVPAQDNCVFTKKRGRRARNSTKMHAGLRKERRAAQKRRQSASLWRICVASESRLTA